MGELKIRFPTAGIAGPARPAVANGTPAENASTDTKQAAQDGKTKEGNGNNNITTNNSHQYNATGASRSATDYTASSSGAPTNTTGPL